MKRFALFALLLGACTKDNPYYRGDGGGDDSGSNGSCGSAADCSGGMPACDTTSGMCVACTATDIGACTGTSPICSSANTCGPCATHDECTASNACLPSGACGTDTDVAYVAAGGTDTGACTHDAPCQTLTFAAGRGKPYVKLQNDIDEAVAFSAGTVTVLADPGTAIRRTTTGPVVSVSGTANVTLWNVVIRDGASTSHHGISIADTETNVKLTLNDVAIINNVGKGISMGTGELTMNRSIVANNNGGGASITGNFTVTNSIFVKNGTSGSTVGGVLITPFPTTHVFAFNTVADNMTMFSTGRDLNCTMALDVHSSIVQGNPPSTSCAFDYSLLDASTTGTGNKTGDAMFLDTTVTNALMPTFYRINENSAARDAATPASDVMDDIDGDARPQGAVRDIGADEYK